MVEAIKRPAWSWDFLSTDAYSYANLNKEVPADSLASFVNSQVRGSHHPTPFGVYVRLCYKLAVLRDTGAPPVASMGG
jgi:hypothetical protein